MANPRLHMSNKYTSLRYLEGAKLRILGGVHLEAEPEEVELVKDYPKTILIRMKFVKSDWGLTIPPRYVMLMIPKASLAVKHVWMELAETGQPLHGRAIAPELLSDADCVVK